jgi:hypothetical protein
MTMMVGYWTAYCLDGALYTILGVGMMIIDNKFRVGDIVTVNNSSLDPWEGEVISIHVSYVIKDDAGIVYRFSEQDLSLISRPCKHSYGYHDNRIGFTDEQTYIKYKFCPLCGEELKREHA